MTTTLATHDLALERGVGIVRLLAKAFGVRRCDYASRRWSAREAPDGKSNEDGFAVDRFLTDAELGVRLTIDDF